MDVAVITACFGNFDQIRPQTAQDLDVTWTVFTDDPELDPPEPWRVEFEQAKGHPNLQAKKFKLLPPVRNRYVIWIDANMQITSPYFAQQALESIHDGIAVHSHPRRDCIYEEAEACLTYESQGDKYASQPIREQVWNYCAQGFPAHAGLYACGTIAWDRQDLRARRLGYAWLAECARWSYQDQLSFPVVCNRLGIEPGVFPHPQLERSRPVLANRWLEIHPHLS